MHVVCWCIHIFVGPGGAFVVLDPPSNLDRMNENEGVALMTLTEGVVPVRFDDVRIPQRMVRDNKNRQHGFCYHNVKIVLQNVTFVDLEHCCGRFCDGYGQYEGGKQARICACFALSKREADVVAAMDLKLVTQDGREMIVRYFTSRSFTNFFLKQGHIPSGVSAVQFYSDRRVKVNTYNVMDRMISYVNRGGDIDSDLDDVSDEMRRTQSGFTIFGWCRLGKIQDQSSKTVDTSGLASRNEKRTMISATDRIYHLCSVTPTSLDHMGQLEEMRLDTSTLASAPIAANNSDNVSDRRARV